MKKLTSKFLNITIVIICSISLAEAEHPRVEISKKDCIRLIRQIKTADVEYKPGINVRGQKILPADLSSRNTIKLPDVFEFNIAIDIRKYLGGPEDDAAASSAAVILSLIHI